MDTCRPSPITFRRRPAAAAAAFAAGLLLSATACTAPQPAGPQDTSSASAGTATGAPAATGTASAPATKPSGAAKGSTGSSSGTVSIPQIVKDVEPSVVTIRTDEGLGSGVVYRADGTILSDAHVVEDQQKQPFRTVQVQFADGSQADATVVGVDNPTDVAVIKAKRTGLPAATFATAEPEVGSLTVVIGTPLGLTETVTSGIVSGLHRNMPPSQESPSGSLDLLQTDAAISPGNSGGAVVGPDGKVIGLSEAYIPPSSGAVAIGFVTPSTTVTNVAEQLLKNGTVKHALLGVVPTDLTPQIAQQFNLSATEGALVIDVSSGGPAAKAGISAGDIIISFGGTKVSSVTDLLAALRQHDPGQRVDVTVRRGSGTKTVSVTLGNSAGG
ncbi:trypsin-like peptidase domain-containing protein [Paenarthrobacter sp. DKR-5]|uniref:S1C family serine protease n=1 Tax=Paenarthrobacter sp. DKR-5 TaxID=2835535 RepID=UPI001BDD6A4D|nr:trypsin-like peptidase domain-containing protein [Paenarthrobacter sp. DKR-5]MBT1004059.1 trypsin-like peptidase domain-containing protein [Paenarthrobacter sp. DKR-5]